MKSIQSATRHALVLGLAACALAPAATWAATYTVASPNGQIVVQVTHDTTAGTLSYSVTKGSSTVLESSRLGLVTSGADFRSGLAFVARNDASIDNSYALPGRKKATYTDRARQMTLRFTRNSNELQLVVRAYDDGIAWRYALPGTGSTSILSESSAFNLPDAASGWGQPFVVTYERPYAPQANFNSGSFGMPVLARTGNDWLLLSESDVASSFPASHLDGSAGNVLKATPPDTAAVPATLPFQGPWRLAMIGGLDSIVQSTLVENLSAPSQIADTSWIRPGRASWSWMAGAAQGDYNAHLPFVDQAAAMGWEYYLVDEGWSDSWVPTLVDYARARNVDIVLWSHNNRVDTEAKARPLFAQWAQWGVKGVKVDFFENDNLVTMQRYEMLARLAAEYKLVVNFHGATKPNGLMRKWPNILSQEAVYGAEQRSIPATHDVSLVFTRNAVGPMDYTPVDYSVINDGNTTWAHQTALAVVYSSYIEHFSDQWAAYRDSVAVDFLRGVPSVWDDTRLLEGAPDQYATVARRRGAEWYVGTISGLGSARTAAVPLSFLQPGVSYTAQIYRDGLSAHDIAYETRSVTSTSVLNLPVAVHGGAAVRISRQAPTSALQNLAAGKAASADSSCAATEGANKAVNGSVSGGNPDKWCSSGASKWLKVDLGGSYTLNQVTLRHAGAGGESPALNTRDFNLQASTDNVNWSTVATVGGNTADVTTHALPSVNARYLRLNVSTGAQSPQANIARIYELEAYGQGAFDTRARYKIVNRASGKALAVQNAGLGDSAPVVQWDYVDTTTNDEWRLVDVGGGYYDIVNAYSGKALDVQGGVADDGKPLIQYASHGSPNQQWQLVPTDSGFHRIVSRNSGKVADVQGQSVDNGAPVIQYPWNGQGNQQWQLIQVP